MATSSPRAWQSHLVGRVAEETFREQLAADNHVPAHGENADESQRSGDRIDALADNFVQFHDLGEKTAAPEESGCR